MVREPPRSRAGYGDMSEKVPLAARFSVLVKWAVFVVEAGIDSGWVGSGGTNFNSVTPPIAALWVERGDRKTGKRS